MGGEAFHPSMTLLKCFKFEFGLLTGDTVLTVANHPDLMFSWSEWTRRIDELRACQAKAG